MIQKYLDILDIQKYTTKDVLKRAYRKKAKELHPDRNPSPNAHEEFILLNEAYEYLSNKGSGETFCYNHKTYTNENSYQRDWEKEQKEKARAKARRYAKMKREEYMNSPYYKKTEALGLILDLILNFIGMVVMMTFMGTIIIMGGWYGAVFVLFLSILTYSKWKALITSLIIKDIEEYKEAITLIVGSFYFKKALFAAINIFLFFNYTVNTLIKPWYFLMVMVFAQIAVFGIQFIGKGNWYSKRKLFAIIGIAPLVFNLPFFLNYSFSTSPVKETFFFGNHWSSYKNVIQLEGGAYLNYPQIRTTFDADPARLHDKITYQFETGLFGIKVLKDYELHKKF